MPDANSKMLCPLLLAVLSEGQTVALGQHPLRSNVWSLHQHHSGNLTKDLTENIPCHKLLAYQKIRLKFSLIDLMGVSSPILGGMEKFH